MNTSQEKEAQDAANAFPKLTSLAALGQISGSFKFKSPLAEIGESLKNYKSPLAEMAESLKNHKSPLAEIGESLKNYKSPLAEMAESLKNHKSPFEGIGEKLKEMTTAGLSQRKMADILGCSQMKVRYHLDKFDLATMNQVCNKKDSFLCKECGETDAEKAKDSGNGKRSKSICSMCHNRRRAELFRVNKKKALDYKGGKCKNCGYDKCPGSLHFHHRDPLEKDPEWNKIRSYQWERLVEELDRCDLLCANCHGEAHWSQ